MFSGKSRAAASLAMATRAGASCALGEATQAAGIRPRASALVLGPSEPNRLSLGHAALQADYCKNQWQDRIFHKQISPGRLYIAGYT
jgi:hypothetical protein